MPFFQCIFHLNQVALWRYPSSFGDTAAYVEAWTKLVNMSKAAGVDHLIYDLTGNGGGMGETSCPSHFAPTL